MYLLGGSKEKAVVGTNGIAHLTKIALGMERKGEGGEKDRLALLSASSRLANTKTSPGMRVSSLFF